MTTSANNPVINYLNSLIADNSTKGLTKEFCRNIQKYLNIRPTQSDMIKVIDAHINNCDSNTIEFRSILSQVKTFILNN